MPDNSPMRARLDHVDGNGNLVFVVRGASFIVTPDDAFDAAVERSRRIRHGEPHERRPSSAAPIPIARIQSMIRAGATPRDVADELGVDEPTVERFSPIVETEKNYAIDRFLESPAPSDYDGASVGDLIHRSLTLRDADMKSLSWHAMRRGVDPWRITVEFDVAGRHIRAIWSWSPQDRAIASLNNTARMLLNDIIDRRVVPHGESERREGSMTPDGAELFTPTAAGEAAPATPAAQATADIHIADDENRPMVVRPGKPAVPPLPLEKPGQDGESMATNAQPPASETDSEDPRFIRTSRRRKGRSAVPSWDEILFGD